MPTGTCRGLADNSQLSWSIGNISRAHCVSIHLRPIERGKIGVGDYIFGKNSTCAIAELNTLSTKSSNYACHCLDGIHNRNHYGIWHTKTLIRIYWYML